MAVTAGQNAGVVTMSSGSSSTASSGEVAVDTASSCAVSGDATIRSGASSCASGELHLCTGESASGCAGEVSLRAGNVAISAGSSGDTTGSGGDAILHGASGHSAGGDVRVGGPVARGPGNGSNTRSRQIKDDEVCIERCRWSCHGADRLLASRRAQHHEAQPHAARHHLDTFWTLILLQLQYMGIGRQKRRRRFDSNTMTIHTVGPCLGPNSIPGPGPALAVATVRVDLAGALQTVRLHPHTAPAAATAVGAVIIVV